MPRTFQRFLHLRRKSRLASFSSSQLLRRKTRAGPGRNSVSRNAALVFRIPRRDVYNYSLKPRTRGSLDASRSDQWKSRLIATSGRLVQPIRGDSSFMGITVNPLPCDLFFSYDRRKFLDDLVERVASFRYILMFALNCNNS